MSLHIDSLKGYHLILVQLKVNAEDLHMMITSGSAEIKSVLFGINLFHLHVLLLGVCYLGNMAIGSNTNIKQI